MRPLTIDELKKRHDNTSGKLHYWKQIALGKDKETQAIVKMNMRLSKCLKDIEVRYPDIIINRDLLKCEGE